MSRRTVTVILPGFTVSVQSTHAASAPSARAAVPGAASGLLTLSATVVL